MKCNNCGRYNEDQYKFCGTCGTPLIQPSVLREQTAGQAVRAAEGTLPIDCTLEQRRTILGWAISQRIRSGYRLIERSDTNALLVRPKTLNVTFIVISTLLIAAFGLGLLLLAGYLIVYLARQNKSVYLEVDRLGRLKVTEDWMV